MVKSTAAAAVAVMVPAPRKAVAANSSPAEPSDQGIDPLPASAYRDRLQRAQALMAEYDHAAIFCEPGTNFAYLSGASFGRSERLIALVIPRNGELVVIAPSFEVERVERALGPTDIRGWQEEKDPHQLVADALTGAGRGRIGIEPSTRFGVVSRLRQALPEREFVDATDLFTRLRIIKSDEELALIRRAVSITQRAIAATFAGLEPGMTERDVAELLSETMAADGARGGGLVQFGPNSALPHGGPGGAALAPGTPVLIDSGCRVHGYTSDITRMHYFGDDPSPRYAEIFNTVLSAQTAAYEAGGPGMECQQLDRIARRLIEEAGYGDYFTHRLGHGMGMDGHEPPYLVEGNRRHLEPGMVFTIEPGIYLPGEWGVRIEDDFVVREDGLEPLSTRTSSI
jgi:Xaa-Pro dipeptidase